MPRTTLIILSLAIAVILIGCYKSATTNNSNSTSSTSEKPAATKAGTETASTTSGDKVGIAECDDFIAKYEACVSNKVPAVARAQYENMLKTWKTEWKKAAGNPQTRGTLAAACKQIAEQQNAAFKAYGCSF